MLDPNREVEARYTSYSAALKDGRVVTGMIAAETANARTLKRQEGQSDTVLRTELEEMKASGRSLMPEGLENDVTPVELADVFAFIARGQHCETVRESAANGRSEYEWDDPPGGVNPCRVRPDSDIQIEFGNLGLWNDSHDHAAWTFHVDRPAMFTISVDWACADDSAGNFFQVRIDNTSFRAMVGATGSWANYRSLFLNEVRLEAGDHRLDMSPVGPINGALADVRSISLTPSMADLHADEPPSGLRAVDLADQVLDDARLPREREALISQNPRLAAELIGAMARGLGANRAEEYRRIPWIWRVAIAARSPESCGRDPGGS